MSNNGDNDRGVSFGRIMFLKRILDTHSNVDILERHNDIVFEIKRRSQGDDLSIVCIDPYTASLEVVMSVLEEFSAVDIIFIGGKWAGYTTEAYDFCQDNEIGIFNAGFLSGGLYKDEYWTYVKIDEKGKPEKSLHSG